MDFSSLPDDYFITSMQFTKEVHTDVYPSIDPTAPALSHAGKVVIITGASKGLGRRGIVTAFAKAHPAALVLVARNEAQLADVAQDVRDIDVNIKVLTVPTDVSDEAAVAALFDKVKSTFGTADVLVNNAGLSGAEDLVDAVDPQAWWRLMEVNVKGPFLMTRAFLALIGREKPPGAATIVNISSNLAVQVLPTASAYGLSKLAVAHLQQFVAAESPHVTAVALHPGVVRTDLVLDAFRRFATDAPELAGGVAVWLATDAARFLSGRFVDAHWSVDELVQRRDEIVGQGKLLTGLNVKLGKEHVA